MLHFWIWVFVLLAGVQVCASTTADSVYFHIKADTIREIRAGQVVELTYALVNSQFDTASYPVFNDNIEVVSGPKQHKCSSYTLVNGVEARVMKPVSAILCGSGKAARFSSLPHL